MTSDYSPKVALVTGSARRIGASIARILHENGLNIALHYFNSVKEAEQLCVEFNKKREDSAIILRADLTEITEFSSLIKEAANAWGRLDVLVNNASRFYKTPIDETTEQSWDDLINNNLKAPFFLSQAAVPYLKKQRGCIINIADIHADRPMRSYPVYCISKAGLVMMTQSLARELGPDICVNAVSPGAIAWPEGKNALSDEAKEEIINRIPLRRHGTPEAIAKAVLFLVRDADYLTGQILRVDGGRSVFI
jgi:pteridine reductase